MKASSHGSQRAQGAFRSHQSSNDVLSSSSLPQTVSSKTTQRRRNLLGLIADEVGARLPCDWGLSRHSQRKGKRGLIGQSESFAVANERLECRAMLTLELPAYPPVGGVTLTQSGDVSDTGKVFGFDLTANPYTMTLPGIDTLYYGLYNIQVGLAGPANMVDFDSSDLIVSGNQATWERSDIPFSSNDSPFNPTGTVTGRLVLDFSDVTDSSLLSGVNLPDGYAAPPDGHTSGALLAVREGDRDFTAQFRFEVFDGSNWVSAKSYYDANSVYSGGLVVSINGGFWQERDPIAVASPADSTPDEWSLVSDGVDVTLSLDGTPVFVYPASLTDSMTLTGSADDDSMLVDVQNLGTITAIFDGGPGGSDSLELIDSGMSVHTSVSHIFDNENDGSIVVSGGPSITYTSLEPIIDRLVSADRVFSFAGSSADVMLTAGPGAGLDLRIDSSVSESVDFTAPTGSVTINTTGLADTFAIAASVPGGLVLAGGGGDDVYGIDSDVPLGQIRIDESGGGVDTIDFSATTTAGVVINLKSVVAQVVNSNLSIILDTGSSVENATGGSGNDTLLGNSLGNVLTGGAGDDTFYGVAGNDTLIGGTGDDTYVFGPATSAESDTVTELASEGTDSLKFNTLTTDVVVSLGSTTVRTVHTNRQLKLNSGSTIEKAIGGSGNDTLTGNSLGNVLIGGAGNDTLTGVAGNDSLFGGTGDDTYVFGTATSAESDTVTELASEGTDSLKFNTLTTDVVVSLGSTTVRTVHTNRQLKLNSGSTIEKAIGGSGNDTLTGNSLGNVLIGSAGNDTLTGVAGNDSLFGGAGDDTYVFGTATSAESDTVTELASEGTDSLKFNTLTTDVVLSLGSTVLRTVHTNRQLQLTSGSTIEKATGGSGNDTLTGNSLANALIGGAGNDTLTGVAGNDALFGGTGNDTYVFGTALSAESDTVTELASEGTDSLKFNTLTTNVVLSLGSTAVQAVHTNRQLKLTSGSTVEKAIGGSGNDTLTGNSLGNVLTGGAGNDILVGLDGNDSLAGDSDYDILIGGPGLDTLNGGDGEDILIAGTTDLSTSFAGLNAVRAEWVSGASYATRVDNLRNGVGSPTVSLKARVNVLDDSGDVDSLTGGSGSDWYFKAIDEVIADLAIEELVDAL
jgi:Ca2+-binding RTX toxin-like protein